jgi:hypothetical protein
MDLFAVRGIYLPRYLRRQPKYAIFPTVIAIALAASRSEDVLIVHKSLLGMVLDVERVFDELHRNATDGGCPPNLTHSGRGQKRWSARALRQCLPERDGQGYWDFFKPTDHMTVSTRTRPTIKMHGPR